MEPVLQFKSHIVGRNADVTLYPDRLEWRRKSGIGWIICAVFTVGISLLFWRPRTDVETIPLRSVSGVSTDQGNWFTTVNVTAHSGATIGFRVSRDTARRFTEALVRQPPNLG